MANERKKSKNEHRITSWLSVFDNLLFSQIAANVRSITRLIIAVIPSRAVPLLLEKSVCLE